MSVYVFVETFISQLRIREILNKNNSNFNTTKNLVKSVHFANNKSFFGSIEFLSLQK